MKGSDAVSKFYRPSLSAKVDYWCIDASNHLEVPLSTRKTKFSQTHPVLPLLMSVDENQTIAVWDFDTKQIIWSRNMVQLHSEVSSAVAVGQGNASQIPKGGSTYSRSKGLTRSLGRSQETLPVHNMNNVVFERVTAQIDDVQLAQPALSKAANQHLGELKFAGFADSQYIDYDTGRSNGNQITSNPWIHFRATNVGIEHRLVFVFDSVVVVYNYVTNKMDVISSSDLNHKKPSCVEFLDYDKLAIGCNDGVVRIWNCSTAIIDASFGLSSSNKEVTLIKVLPLEWDAPNNTEGENSAYTKIRILTAGADGLAQFWSLDFSGSRLSGGTEQPFAKLLDIYANKLSASNLLVDREKKTVMINTDERKVSIWDFQDILSAERNAKRGSQSKKTSQRRSSIFGRKSQEIDEVLTLSPQVTFKLDKSFPATFPKLSSMCGLKHPFFYASNSFLVCSKTGSLAVVQNNKGAPVGDESERMSTVSAAQEKAQRVDLMHEINVAQLLNEYSLQTYFFNAVPSDTLKIYLVNTSASRPELCFLTTNVGLIVISFSHLPINSFVAFHHQWPNRHITVADTTLKVLTSNYRDTGVPANGLAIQEDFDSGDSYTGYGSTSELRLSSLERRQSINKGLSGSMMGSSSSTIAGAALLLPSPSGRYLAIVWPETMNYLIVLVPSFTTDGVDDNNNNILMSEIDRGNCLDFAWIGIDDHFLIITPGYFQFGEKQSNRRFGMFGGGGTKIDKDARTWIESKYVVKHIPSVAPAPSSSDATGVAPSNGEDTNNGSSRGKVVTYSFIRESNGNEIVVPTQVLGLFSGNLLCKNFVQGSNGPANTVPNDLTSFWLPSKNSIVGASSGSVSYSRFFGLKILKEENSVTLLPLTPLACAVIDVAWDYDHGFCATLSNNGVVNILHYSCKSENGTVSLQAFANIDTYCLSGLNFVRWYQGALITESHKGARIHYLISNEDDEVGEYQNENKKWRIHSTDGVFKPQ